jgi:hypothetical protein
LCIEVLNYNPELRDGFHEAEESHRWTDGWAWVPARWLHSFEGAFELEIHLAPNCLVYRRTLPRIVAA